jgi:lipid II:glycine glycyltransferase (peptidoglycan interpeptide bridge formation enzyme)
VELGALNHGLQVEIDNVSRDDWTYLLEQFGDATIYQSWAYGSVRWGKNSLSHLVIKRDREVIALSQVAIKKVPGIGAGIAYVPWGPIWRKRKNPTDIEVLRQAIICLREEYLRKRGLFLRISPEVIDDQNNSVARLFEGQGFSCNFSTPRYRTLLLDLAPPVNELRANLNQKWRNQLNQAERNRLEIVEGTSDELYRAFLGLQREMQGRKKYVPGVDYDEFGVIQRELPDSLKMNIMICKCEGEPVSSAVFSAIGDTGIYLLGATGDKGMKVKGSYLLQWRVVQRLKEIGCRWYDLGGINPQKNQGVYHFKAGLSGKDLNHIGQFEACTNFLSALVVRSGESARASLQWILNRRAPSPNRQ